ncbi:943_t:CDS:2 [Dentiscutata erythropus]|uniref:943_t:CDS:1 n=1 Tax=Dentiscutata erythropus TaxID=1348616 RepID=A0A9N9IC07_9GLOM|nr:943_t:CDS:2 [Dentiscutata erythropus]
MRKEEARNDDSKSFDQQHFNHIYFAAKKNYENIIKLLLEEATSDLILHHIAEEEDIKVVIILLENGANFNSITDMNSRTPLHWAAFEGCEDDIKYLIRKNKNLIKANDNNNEAAIYESVWNGHIEITKFLLEQDPDIIYSKNKYGYTFLQIAAISCQVEIFNYLKSKGNFQFELDNFFDNLDWHKLNNYTKFMHSYSTIKGLINKLYNLEEQFVKLDNSDFISFYQFLLKCIEKCAENLGIKEEYKKILNYLYTCTFGKICNLKLELKFSLVIDIDEYFKMIQNGIKLLKKVNKQVEIDKFSKQYEDTIKKKIKEAYNIAKNQVKYEIDKTVNEINEKIISLINETRNLIGGAEETKQTLEEKQREIDYKLALKQILGILKIVGQTVSIAGGPIGIAGYIINGGVNITESFVSKYDNFKSKFEIPLEIRDSLDKMETMIKYKEIKVEGEEIVKIAKQQIEILSLECDKHTILSDIKGHLIKIQKALGNISTNIVNEIKDELETIQNNVELKEAKIEIDVVQTIFIAIRDTGMAVELYNNDAIVPMIKRMKDDINNIEKKINNKSHAYLDMTKWQVQSSLKDVKYTVQQISKGFSAQDITRYMEKLDEAMTTIINIYDRIREYYDQVNLANYTARINSPMTIELEDEELKVDIYKLEQKIRSSIIKGYLKRARSAFKQWAFPFANEYSNVLNSQFDKEEDIDSIMQQIESLHIKVQERNVYVIKDIDNFLKYSEFNSKNRSTQPFFVWENNKHSQEMSELLVGKEVTIKADITEINSHKSAVKFNEIGIRFKSKDKTIQDKIDDELENFDVKMIHSGDSYYRYNDKFYVIRSNEQSIEYSFEKNNEGKPVRSNRVYERIRNEELMLSPYTTWKIKLKYESKDANFDKLKMYEEKVCLELIGRGIYVDGEDSNDLMVGNYYKEYEYNPI